MHVSYAELVRVGTEAIRMTGFTFGQADDALEGIVWSECVLGRGCALLRMADRERPTQGWPQHSVTSAHSGTAHVALTGLPAFGFAARLADLARATAAEPAAGGFGTVEVSGAFGGWITPYIAYRLARANHHAAVLWLPGRAARTGEAPASLIVATAPVGEMTPLLIAPGTAYGMREESRPWQGAIPRRLLEAVSRVANQHSDDGLLAIATASLPCPGPLVEFASALDTVGCADLSRASPAMLDGSGTLREAIEVGIDVAPEDHRVLTTLSTRIRLPNTERSKSQAG